MLDLRGVFTATITPFDERGEVDMDYVTRHLEFQEEHGITGIIPSGTNGEGVSMSLAERKRLLEHVVSNKGKLQVIPGTGCANLPETVELTKFAERIGADAALILPPFFFKSPPKQGLVDYFRRVFDSVSIPVLLYNIPSLTAVEISDDLLSALADYPHLIGVKDTSKDPDRLKRYVENFPHLQILVGYDNLADFALNLGAAGVISGTSNVLPEHLAEVFRCFRNGRDASLAQGRATRFAEIFERYPARSSTKYALTMRGFPQVYVRPPMAEMTEEQKAALKRDLGAEGFPTGSG